MRLNRLSISQSLRLPVICTLCRHYHDKKQAVCDDCLSLFLPLTTGCKCCALPLIDDTFALCGHCISEPPAFDEIVAVYHLEEPLRTLLHQFKYHQGLHLTTLLANLMLTTRHRIHSDCFIPVPIHPKRLQERGYNQAAELAKSLAHQMNTPYTTSLCYKIKNTTSQTTLTRLERQKNVRQSFVAKPCMYSRITIIDDIVTTGSTAHELAQALKRQGAKHVQVWCFARASLGIS